MDVRNGTFQSVTVSFCVVKKLHFHPIDSYFSKLFKMFCSHFSVKDVASTKFLMFWKTDI